jgi:hypothetical protein
MPSEPTYAGYCFSVEVTHHAILLNHLFSLSLPDVELILAERSEGVMNVAPKLVAEMADAIQPGAGRLS